MATLRARPEIQAEPANLQSRAMDDIRFIRETMENAGSFTAVPGRGGLVMGLVALAAAVLSEAIPGRAAFLTIWLSAAALALGLGGIAMARKARVVGTRFFSLAGRRFVLGLVPALAAAAVLTAELAGSDHFEAIPGCWLLLYGAGVVSAGAFSVRPVPIMGGAFMVLGLLTFLAPPAWSNGMMALGFGGFHLLVGWQIARRHGG